MSSNRRVSKSTDKLTAVARADKYLSKSSNESFRSLESGDYPPKSRSAGVLGKKAAVGSNAQRNKIQPPYGYNYLHNATSPNDLIKRLVFLAESLSETSQDEGERPRGLCDTVSALISPTLIQKFKNQGSHEKQTSMRRKSYGGKEKEKRKGHNQAYNEKEQDAQQTLIELLICRCITDVLRIYAPEAPYNTECLLQIFQLVTKHLYSLKYNSLNSLKISGQEGIVSSLSKSKSKDGRDSDSDNDEDNSDMDEKDEDKDKSQMSPSRNKRMKLDNMNMLVYKELHDESLYKLLYNLATVKSCIILSELCQQDEPGAESLLFQFVSCLLTSIRDDHSRAIKNHILEILICIIDELEIIPVSLMYSILYAFFYVPPNQFLTNTDDKTSTNTTANCKVKQEIKTNKIKMGQKNKQGKGKGEMDSDDDESDEDSEKDSDSNSDSNSDNDCDDDDVNKASNPKKTQPKKNSEGEGNIVEKEKQKKKQSIRSVLPTTITSTGTRKQNTVLLMAQHICKIMYTKMEKPMISFITQTLNGKILFISRRYEEEEEEEEEDEENPEGEGEGKEGNHRSTILSKVKSVNTSRLHNIKTYLEKNIYSLIFELHKVNPLIMVTLFPIIGVNLKSEDIDTRKQVINFLGRIFASDVPAPAQAQAQANVTIELSSNSSNNSNVNIISSTSLSSPTTSASTTTTTTTSSSGTTSTHNNSKFSLPNGATAPQQINYGLMFPKIFQEFLGRFRDLCPQIRSQMVKIGALLLRTKPALGEMIRPELAERFRDPEAELRSEVISQVETLALLHSSTGKDLAAVSSNFLRNNSTKDLDSKKLRLNFFVDESLLKALGERVMDKRPSVHHRALIALARIYSRYVSVKFVKSLVIKEYVTSKANTRPSASASTSPRSLSTAEQNEVIPDVMDDLAARIPSTLEPLAFIPNLIFKCYSIPSEETKLLVLQIMDEILIPAQGLAEERALAFLILYVHLDAPSKEAFFTILKDRTKDAFLFKRYLHLRTLRRESFIDDDASDENKNEKIEAQLQDVIQSLTESIPLPAGATSQSKRNLFKKLDEQKDQRIFKNFAALCRPDLPIREIFKCREDTISRCRNASTLKEYVKNICRRISLFVLNKEMVLILLDLLCVHYKLLPFKMKELIETESKLNIQLQEGKSVRGEEDGRGSEEKEKSKSMKVDAGTSHTGKRKSRGERQEKDEEDNLEGGIKKKERRQSNEKTVLESKKKKRKLSLSSTEDSNSDDEGEDNEDSEDSDDFSSNDKRKESKGKEGDDEGEDHDIFECDEKKNKQKSINDHSNIQGISPFQEKTEKEDVVNALLSTRAKLSNLKKSYNFKSVIEPLCWMIKYNTSDYQDATCLVNIFKCFWVIRKREELSIEVLRVLGVASRGKDTKEGNEKGNRGSNKISTQLVEVQMKKELEKHIAKFAKYVQALIQPEKYDDNSNNTHGERQSHRFTYSQTSPHKIKLALNALISVSAVLKKKTFLPLIYEPLISSLRVNISTTQSYVLPLENNLKVLTQIAIFEPIIFLAENSTTCAKKTTYEKVKEFVLELLYSKFTLSLEERDQKIFDSPTVKTKMNELKVKASSECRVVVSALKLLAACQQRAIVGGIQKQKQSKERDGREDDVQVAASASPDELDSSGGSRLSGSSVSSTSNSSYSFLVDKNTNKNDTSASCHDVDEEVIDLLFNIVEDGGELPSGQHFSTRNKAYIRLVAANMLLKVIASFPTLTAKFISIERWHMLGFMCIDADSLVRSIFMRKILKALYGNYGFGCGSSSSSGNKSPYPLSARGRGMLPLKYISYLCLAGDDDNESLKKEISQKLSHYIRQLRAKNNALQMNAISSSRGGNNDILNTNMNMPENIIPYVIHLLAHHPDFPEVGFSTVEKGEKVLQKGRPTPRTKHDSAKVKEMNKYIHFILNPIINTLADGDNISFLLQICDRILSSYHNSDIDIILVTYMVKDALQMRIKTQDNLVTYPGEIYLPKALYKSVTRRQLSSSSSSSSLLRERKEVENNNITKEKVVQEGKVKGKDAGKANSMKENGGDIFEARTEMEKEVETELEKEMIEDSENTNRNNSRISSSYSSSLNTEKSKSTVKAKAKATATVTTTDKKKKTKPSEAKATAPSATSPRPRTPSSSEIRSNKKQQEADCRTLSTDDSSIVGGRILRKRT